MNGPGFSARGVRPVLTIYALTGVVLLFVPLFRVLHVESAAAVALVAFFASGVTAVSWFLRGERFVPTVLRLEATLLVPLVLLTTSMLWVPNCGYLLGLAFFALFPVISAAFAVALAYWITGSPGRFPKATLTLIGVAIAVCPVIFDFGFHPQFYTYNHVFGGVLGPIYDEELALRPGLFWFRLLTLIWTGLLFLSGVSRRRTLTNRQRGLRRLLLLLLAMVYSGGSWLGLNTSDETIRRRLTGEVRTDHFVTRFDPSSVSEARLHYMIRLQEYRFGRLSRQLGTEPEAPIRVYLYPTESAKARLTGARTTSVTPVWLREPQMHLLESEHDAAFGHELVHVFSRSFGAPVINASPSVGLVEGLAVAFEPPDGGPSASEQVASVLGSGFLTVDELAQQVARAMTPLGFWTGRATVSYTTAGSFVRYLVDRYGPDRIRAVYASADFESVYGRSLLALATEWAVSLRTMETREEASQLAGLRFARTSLFERRCPHHIPRHVRLFRSAVEALAQGDTLAAREALVKSNRQRAGWPPARVALARLDLAAGEPEAVVAAFESSDSLQFAAEWLLMADALVLLGDASGAGRAFDSAFVRIPVFDRRGAAIVEVHRATGTNPASLRAQYGGFGYPRDCTGSDMTFGLRWACGVTAARNDDFADAARYLDDNIIPIGVPTESRWRIDQLRLELLAEAQFYAQLYEEAAITSATARDIAANQDQPDLIRYLDDRIRMARWMADRGKG